MTRFAIIGMIFGSILVGSGCGGVADSTADPGTVAADNARHGAYPNQAGCVGGQRYLAHDNTSDGRTYIYLEYSDRCHAYWTELISTSADVCARATVSSIEGGLPSNYTQNPRGWYFWTSDGKCHTWSQMLYNDASVACVKGYATDFNGAGGHLETNCQ
jgi:hypothetical protein